MTPIRAGFEPWLGRTTPLKLKRIPERRQPECNITPDGSNPARFPLQTWRSPRRDFRPINAHLRYA
jgi:hypothetical protein